MDSFSEEEPKVEKKKKVQKPFSKRPWNSTQL